jgi:hypothetical protein
MSPINNGIAFLGYENKIIISFVENLCSVVLACGRPRACAPVYVYVDVRACTHRGVLIRADVPQPLSGPVCSPTSRPNYTVCYSHTVAKKHHALCARPTINKQQRARLTINTQCVLRWVVPFIPLHFRRRKSLKIDQSLKRRVSLLFKRDAYI